MPSILQTIREVDAHRTPADQSRIKEGHPEVSFALMNGGHALTERKSTRAGRDARLRLLEQHFPGIRDEVEKHRTFRGDVIDAFAPCGLLAASAASSAPFPNCLSTAPTLSMQNLGRISMPARLASIPNKLLKIKYLLRKSAIIGNSVLKDIIRI